MNSIKVKPIKSRVGAWFVNPLVLACIAGATLAAPAAVYAQNRGNDGGNAKRNDRRGDTQDRRNDSRDQHDTSRDGGRQRDDSHVQFTHSAEGRHFDNDVTLRRGAPIVDHRFDSYFPHRYYSYPHYASSRDAGHVFASPFNFYVGIFPLYIDRGAVVIAVPRRVFIDIPIYVHNEYRPYGEGRDDYYLNRRNDDNRWKDDPDLKRTVYDLEDAFRNDDIALLAPLTGPK